MQSSPFFKKVVQTVSKRTPAILTAMGVGGVISTTVLAVQATPPAQRDIWDAEQDIIDDTRTMIQKATDRVKVAWPHYIPVALSGGATILCIISAQNISSKRLAAAMSLYTASERFIDDYQNKVRERFGEKKEQAIREEIAIDKLEEAQIDSTKIDPGREGDVLFFDPLTSRTFWSTVEKVRKAVNDINAMAINEFGSPSQNQFYEMIGLEPVQFGDEHGWRSDRLLEIELPAHKTTDGKPCLSIDYRVVPIRGYWKLYPDK